MADPNVHQGTVEYFKSLSPERAAALVSVFKGTLLEKMYHDAYLAVFGRSSPRTVEENQVCPHIPEEHNRCCVQQLRWRKENLQEKRRQARTFSDYELAVRTYHVLHKSFPRRHHLVAGLRLEIWLWKVALSDELLRRGRWFWFLFTRAGEQVALQQVRQMRRASLN